jgi:hypothetical protein
VHIFTSNRLNNAYFFKKSNYIYSKIWNNQFGLQHNVTKMPIIVKDFTWTQSESRICINLPLKGTKATNLDILNSLNFIKVWNFSLSHFLIMLNWFPIKIHLKISYSPFIFECWLHEKIKDEEGTAIVNNGIISLQFSKEEEVIWPCLFHPDFGKLSFNCLLFEWFILSAEEIYTDLQILSTDEFFIKNLTSHHSSLFALYWIYLITFYDLFRK